MRILGQGSSVRVLWSVLSLSLFGLACGWETDVEEYSTGIDSGIAEIATPGSSIASAGTAARAAVDGAVSPASQALTGTTVAESSCLQNEANLAVWAVEAARFVAVSTGFYECMTDAVAGTVSLRHNGSAVNAGPYIPYAGDPFASNSKGVQTTYARTAAESPTSITLKCGGSSAESAGLLAYATIGTYDQQRVTAEVMTAASGWRQLASSDGGQAPSTATVQQFYQATRRQAANSIWHEAMHQWGYRHAGGGWTQALENTMPYIVGDCIEAVMARSAGCGSCGALMRPVMRFRSGTCDCIADPQYDVGVLTSANADGSSTEHCSFVDGNAGRSSPGDGPTFWMDTENDGTDDSAQTGWSSSMHVWKDIGEVSISLCRVPGINFRRKRLAAGATNAQLTAANYAVARLGASCPPGSVSAARFFDNEDDDNGNTAYGFVAPHRIVNNLRLELCVFQGTTSLTNSAVDPFPSINQGLPGDVDVMNYGVFAGSAFPGALATGAVFTDDENTNNSNLVYGVSSATTPFIEQTANNNTRMRTVRVE